MGSLSNHVSVTISRNSNGLRKAGFGTMLVLAPNAPAGGWVGSEKTRSYADTDEAAVDWPNPGSAEYRAISAALSQDPAPESVKVGRVTLPSTIAYRISPVVAETARRYAITATGDGVTETEVAYTSVPDIAIAVADSTAIQINVVAVAKTFTRLTGSFITDGFIPGQIVTVSGFTNGGNNGAKTIATVSALVLTMSVSTGLVDETGGGDERAVGPIVTAGDDKFFTSSAHGVTSGEGPVRLTTTGSLPTNSAVDTNYWLIAPTATSLQLATSRALALAGTAMDIADSGTGVITIQRDANDVICAQLVQGLNDVAGKNFTAAQVTGSGDTDYVTVTASAAGEWFALEVMDLASIKSTMTHADPGVSTDLTAIELKDGDWYALDTSPMGNSDAIAKAAAAWIESRDKICVLTSSDTEAATTAAGTGDTLDDLKALDYDRTAAIYHPRANEFPASAWMGRVLPITAGSETWKFKELAGVTVTDLTSTQRANVIARNANLYEQGRGAQWTAEGTACSGEFLDTIRGLDWWKDDIQVTQLQVQLDNDKVEMEDSGAAKFEAALRGSTERAQQRKVIALDPEPKFTVPRVSSLSDAQRRARNYTGLKVSARLSGAIHTVGITITVVP